MGRSSILLHTRLLWFQLKRFVMILIAGFYACRWCAADPNQHSTARWWFGHTQQQQHERDVLWPGRWLGDTAATDSHVECDEDDTWQEDAMLLLCGCRCAGLVGLLFCIVVVVVVLWLLFSWLSLYWDVVVVLISYHYFVDADTTLTTTQFGGSGVGIPDHCPKTHGDTAGFSNQVAASCSGEYSLRLYFSVI